MRYPGSLLLSLVLLPGVVVAQQAEPQPQQQQQQPPGAGGGQFLTKPEQDQVTTQDLVGGTVFNQQGEQVGTISELVVSEDGELAGAVISVGGFLGIGDKNVGVTWDQMELVRDPETNQYSARVDMQRDELEAAPEFTRQQQSGQ